MSNTVAHRPAPSLPATKTDLLALRKIMSKRTLNDYVDEIHIRLWEDPDYQKLLDAVYDEDAVEGSCAADNLVLAQKIRQHAGENHIDYVADKKLATIVKSLNVVLRRYGISRNERRSMVGGEPVASSGNSDNE